MSGQGGWQRHFRPAPTWPRAGSAHEQLSMEITRSGEGERCLGKSAPGVAVSCECGTPQGSRDGEDRAGGPAGWLWFYFSFRGLATLRDEAFVLEQEAVPLSLSITRFVGRTRTSPPSCAARPRGPRRPSLPPPWSPAGSGRRFRDSRQQGLGFPGASCVPGLQGDTALPGNVWAPEFFRDLISPLCIQA